MSNKHRPAPNAGQEQHSGSTGQPAPGMAQSARLKPGLPQHRSRFLTCFSRLLTYFPDIFCWMLFFTIPTRLLQHLSGSCCVKESLLPCPRIIFYSNKHNPRFPYQKLLFTTFSLNVLTQQTGVCLFEREAEPGALCSARRVGNPTGAVLHSPGFAK